MPYKIITYAHLKVNSVYSLSVGGVLVEDERKRGLRHRPRFGDFERIEMASEITEIAINHPQTRRRSLKPWFMMRFEALSSLAQNTCYCQAVCKQL